MRGSRGRGMVGGAQEIGVWTEMKDVYIIEG